MGVGVGYVGIKLVLELQKRIFLYIALIRFSKTQKNKIETHLFSYIKNEEFINIKKFSINKDFKKISECDVIIICLPTPLKYNEPDLSQITNTWLKIKNLIKKNQLIILESTTYPGTTEEIFLKYLSSKFKIDENIFLFIFT